MKYSFRARIKQYMYFYIDATEYRCIMQIAGFWEKRFLQPFPVVHYCYCYFYSDFDFNSWIQVIGRWTLLKYSICGKVRFASAVASLCIFFSHLHRHIQCKLPFCRSNLSILVGLLLPFESVFLKCDCLIPCPGRNFHLTAFRPYMPYSSDSEQSILCIKRTLCSRMCLSKSL